MCGISGCIIKNKNYLKYMHAYNNKLLKYLHNRGPDQKGTYIFKNVSLNHNRLSINDIDDRSKQPFYFKNLIMIFNGEIYNFIELKDFLIKKYNTTFIGKSDTEVLIQLFYYEGIEKTVKLINGIFAIGLYNSETNEMFIIRDRIGVKYCYYYDDDNIFMFSSNPGSLAKTLNEVNNTKFDINTPVLFSYLASGICLSSESMFKNIKGVDFGYFIKIDVKSFKMEHCKWWTPNLNRENDDLQKSIETSIELQEIGDVGKNILYSGGIDSNVLAKYSKDSNLVTLAVGEENVAKECCNILNKKLKVIASSFLEKNLSKFISEQRKIINFSGIPIIDICNSIPIKR